MSGHPREAVPHPAQHPPHHGVRPLRDVRHRHRLRPVRGDILGRDPGGAGQEAGGGSSIPMKETIIWFLSPATGTVPAAAAPRGAAGGGVRARPPGDLAAALPHLRHQGLGAPAELRCVEIATLRPLNTWSYSDLASFYIHVIVKTDGFSLEIDHCYWILQLLCHSRAWCTQVTPQPPICIN